MSQIQRKRSSEPNHALSEFFLDQTEVAHTHLDVASTTADAMRREHNIHAALKSLEQLHEFIGRHAAEGDQREAIIKARDDLAKRLRQFGRCLPALFAIGVDHLQSTTLH